MRNLSFYNSRKIRKTARILRAKVKATVAVIGVVIAGLAVAVFLSPQAVYAEDSQQPKLVKQLKMLLLKRQLRKSQKKKD